MARMNRGKCYEVAGREFLEMNGNALLVHGAPWSHTHNARIGHAWIEETEVLRFQDGTRFLDCTVRDLTQPPEREKMPAVLYYHFGRMTDEHVTRYTKRQVRKMMLKHKTYGPWEGPAAAAKGWEKRKRTSPHLKGG